MCRYKGEGGLIIGIPEANRAASAGGSGERRTRGVTRGVFSISGVSEPDDIDLSDESARATDNVCRASPET